MARPSLELVAAGMAERHRASGVKFVAALRRAQSLPRTGLPLDARVSHEPRRRYAEQVTLFRSTSREALVGLLPRVLAISAREAPSLIISSMRIRSADAIRV